MKFALLVYVDESIINQLPEGEGDAMMRNCLQHADEMHGEGRLIDFQQLELPATAKSVRIRNKNVRVIDGPFAETKEILGGFNLIEAENMEEALRIAAEIPWAQTGCIEVRPVRDIAMVRKHVGL